MNLTEVQEGQEYIIKDLITEDEELEDFLCQDTHEHLTIEDTLQRLSQVSGIEIPEEEYAELQA